jgi:hypothetical protein
LTQFFDQLEAMTHQDGSKPSSRFNEEGEILETLQSSLGLQSFRSMGRSELLDSEQTLKEYLNWVKGHCIMEEGQMLVGNR